MGKQNNSPVWVVGEALIDLISFGTSQLPVVGGGPANTAKALSKLGIKTFFIGGISRDKFGEQISTDLRNSGVILDLSKQSELPTALAIVTLDNCGSPRYEFKLDRTATFDFGDWLPKGKPSVMHIGSLGSVVEPGAGYIFNWAKKIDTQIVYDPNVRPSVLSDKNEYRAIFESWAKISYAVKLSQDELSWLGYSARDIVEMGATLVVVTKGDAGISARSIVEYVEVPAEKIKIVDTVGAGDTVGAVVVEGLCKYGNLEGENLLKVLQKAAKAAAITCSRPGANPPTAIELEA